MNLPELPDVPLDIDEDTKNFVNSLEDMLDSVMLVRVEKDEVHVFGAKYGAFISDYYEIIKNVVTGEIRRISYRGKRNMKKREQRINECGRANMNDAKEKLSSTKIYQGSIQEVEKQLGKKLELVDTGEPETFLKAKDTFWLRVKAYRIGADLLVNYQYSARGDGYYPHILDIGTPVKFVDKKESKKAKD